MPHDAPIPVTLVTGFLGAGKTTRLNAWIGAYPRDDVVVIVNEHGAVGIDGELLGARARNVVEITGGCVCCVTQLELARALDEIAARSPAPSRAFVETSGAASPAGVLRALLRGRSNDALRIDGIIAVVDATRPGVLRDHDLAAEQVGYADIVVLSRADQCDEAALERARESVLAINATAVVTHGSGPPALESLDALLARREGALRILPVRAEGHAHIESVALALEGELDEERFLAWVEEELGRVEGRLLRTKGILAIAGLDVRMILQGVADRMEVDFGEPWADAPRTCRLVLVGFGLDRAALEAGFRACAVTV